MAAKYCSFPSGFGVAWALGVGGEFFLRACVELLCAELLCAELLYAVRFCAVPLCFVPGFPALPSRLAAKCCL